MIKEINISNIASYGNEPVSITDLKELNYFFGSNGTGKTTITRVIKNNNDSIIWGNKKLDCFVYNSDFVEENIQEQLKGIYTLGKNNSTAETEIKGKKEEKENKEKLQRDLEQTLSSKEEDLKNLAKNYQEQFWNIKKELNPVLLDAFKGVNSSKEKFFNELIRNAGNLSNSISPLAEKELCDKAKFLLTKDSNVLLQNIPFLKHIELDALLDDKILDTVIVGKKDINYSALWIKFNNIDWVNEGRGFITEDMICPFCQQKIEHQFIEKLNEYFNEEYDKNIKKISELKIFYNKYTTLYISELSALIELNNEFIDNDSLKHNLNKVKEIFKDNLYNIQQKERYPSNKYELKSHIPIINAIDTVIKAANDNIDKANDLKRDNVKQKEILINDIWIYFIKVLVNASLTSYTNSEKSLRTAITNLTEQINKLKTEIGKLNEEIFELEKSKTNIKEVIVAINNTLNSFGFTNFKLIETDAFNYSIVRENGEPVRKTLSEGEKTFIAFLYFYHLIKGSFYETGTNTDRIIVIDDPVSSLDNNVLFIVTSLIKEIRNSILNNTNYKQLFLFTHNVYFFKQVTYRRKNDKRAMGKTSFWIIRKDKYTNIERKDENPISTSYQLLWNEVKRAYEGKYENKISLCNVLRRILENYLQILGGIDEEAITSEFNGNDKVICYSLFSWVHAGSHNSNNDEFYDISDVELANYLDIFKLIFVKMGHEAHYNMMMEL